jgi:hypothetical protein
MRQKTDMADFKVFYHYFLRGTEGYHKNETELQLKAESER